MFDFESLDFFTSESLANDPYPYFEYLRSKGPVYREPRHGVVVVTGYDEAEAIYRDHKRFSSCIAVSGPFPGIPFKPEGTDISEMIEQHRDRMPLSQFIVTQDGTRHARSRALLMRLFVPSRLKEIAATMRSLAEQQLNVLLESGSCELVSHYAHPFSTLVIAELLGVPESDRDTFARRLRKNWDEWNDADTSESVLQDPFGFLVERFTNYIDERRRQPRKDVLTDLVNAKFPDGSKPEAADLIAVATFLFAAGQDTTALLLAAVFRTLGERPDLQQQLRRERNRIPNFIDETLRLESPVKSVFRLARVALTLGGVQIDAGSTVMILNGAANRDPRRFEQPDKFMLDRPRVSDHLSFGRGVHVCPGNFLARTETLISLETLLDRGVEVSVCETRHGPAHSRRYDFDPTYVLRKLKSLHLNFQPAAA